MCTDSSAIVMVCIERDLNELITEFVPTARVSLVTDDSTGLSRARAYVTVSSFAEADTLLFRLAFVHRLRGHDLHMSYNGTASGPRALSVDRQAAEVEGRIVVLSGLLPRVTERDVVLVLRQFGSIGRIHLNNGSAVVTFMTASAAARALAECARVQTTLCSGEPRPLVLRKFVSGGQRSAAAGPLSALTSTNIPNVSSIASAAPVPPRPPMPLLTSTPSEHHLVCPLSVSLSCARCVSITLSVSRSLFARCASST
jgi:hypothetical protein